MKYQNFFILMLIAVIMGSISALIAPVLIHIWRYEEDVLGIQRLAVLFSVLILTLVIEILVVFLRERFAKSFNIKNCKQLLNKYLGLKYDTLQENGAMFLMERIAIAVNTSYSYFTGESIRAWSSMIIIAVITVLTFLHNPYIAFALIILIPVNVLGYKMINAKLQKNSALMQEVTASSWQKILSVLKHVDYIKQSDQQVHLFGQFTVAVDKIYGTMSKVNVFAQTSSQTLRSINSISNVMIMLVVVHDFLVGGSNPFSLVLYAIILPLYFSNLNDIVRTNLSKREMLASKEFIQMMDDNQEPSGGVDIGAISSIQFKIPELCIGERVLANDIHYEFNSGDIVWVKGSSGKGKSTLLKLLLKFREQSGIYINNTDLAATSIHSLRGNIEYLSQDVPIINGTIRDNLFLGKVYSKAIEDEMRNDPILSSILASKEMDTQILADGANLSGGEKQKIAIARALYNNASVLLLDEITSNIDNASEMEIYDRLTTNCSDKIVFIISHEPLRQEYFNKTLVLGD